MARRELSPEELRRCLQLTREERDRLVVELYKQGVPIEEIARRACINKATIYSILRRHGIEPQRKRRRSRSLTPEEEQRLVEEYERGAPVQELLEKYGISTTKLYEILRRHGVKLRSKRRPSTRRRLTEEELEEIRRMWEEGMSIYAIAKALNRPVSTVYAALKKLGIRE